MKKRKFALVLSGGGFKGAFQLGALNYISDQWEKITGLSTPMKFDIVAGVSVGALNGAFVSMNKLALLNDLWLHQIAKNGVSEIYTSDFIDTASKSDKLKLKLNLKEIAKRLVPKIKVRMNFFEKLGLIFSREKRGRAIQSILKDVEEGIKASFPNLKAIADHTPLRKKLEKYLDRNSIDGTDFLCGFVSLDSGKYHGVLHKEFVSEEDFISGVLASTSMPMIWNPVDRVSFHSGAGLIESRNNIDGGIRNVSPLGDIIKLINEDPEDCDYKIIVINNNSGVLQKENFDNRPITAIAARSVYEIAMSEIFTNDVEHFLSVNKIIKEVKAQDKGISISDGENQLKSFDAVIINPNKDFDLGNPLVANEKLINYRFIHGATMARMAFESKNLRDGKAD